MKKQPKEADITRQIRDYLRLRGIFHWKVMQGLGCERGVADIVGIYQGWPLAIEVKTRTGKLSDYQAEWLSRFSDAGGITVVARCVDDVIRRLGEVRT